MLVMKTKEKTLSDKMNDEFAKDFEDGTIPECKCHRCGAELNNKRIVWLELDNETDLFHKLEDFPEDGISQGCFKFGSACATAQLLETKMELEDGK